MLMKLHKQLPSSIKWESTFPFMSCHWEADQKHTHSTQKELPNWQWQEDGDTLQDYTSTYSEMPGGLDDDALNALRQGVHKDEQIDKLRKHI